MSDWKIQELKKLLRQARKSYQKVDLDGTLIALDEIVELLRNMEEFELAEELNEYVSGGMGFAGFEYISKIVKRW